MAQVITYNLTIDDTSPQIVYAPPALLNGSPVLNSSWSQYFNGVGFNSFPGQIGLRNSSLHITQMNGANFSIAFTGTSIELYGLAVQSTFSVVLDDEDVRSSSLASSSPFNTTLDPTSTLLTSFSGLLEHDHVVSFTAHTTNAENESGSSGFLIFDRAVVTASTGVTDAGITTTIINDTEMQFTGSWTFVNDSALIPEGDHSCHITQAVGDEAQYSFKGSSIELGGLSNASAGLFNISLTSDSDPVTILQQQLSGSSSFLIYTTLFYASGLNPNATHSLKITNAENKTLAVDSMNITVVNRGQTVPSPTPSHPPTSPSGLSRGAIAGIAAASSLAVLFFLGMLALLLCCWRRRRHCRQRQQFEFQTEEKFRPLHRRVESGEVAPISPRWPTRRSSAQHSVSAGNMPSSAGVDAIDSTRTDEDGATTDSGLGHVREKNDSTSIPSFDNIPRKPLPPTREPARHRSFALSRWSGWFTSSSRASSRNSRRNAPSPQTDPIVSPRPVRVYARPDILAPPDVGDARSQRTTSILREANILETPRSSPFEVDFEKHGQLRPAVPSDLPRSVNSGSLGAQAKDIFVSFLDFASSGAASLRESTRSRSRSQRHSTSNKSTSHSTSELQARSAQDSSGQSQTASTGMWTLSLSVEPPRRPARESHELVPTTAVDTIASRHPFSMASADLQAASPDSPTDSLPMSVSDINFRNEEDSESPVLDRTARFHLPRHPPLPGTPHSYTYSSNIHPPEFARAGHMRQMSAPNLGSMEPRRPYVAQTSFGRRLERVRALAIESQASLTLPPHSESPTTSEQPPTQPSSSRLRTLPLPFIHFGRSASGS